MSDNTHEKRVIGVPFQAGNPGRPKGSRNKLGEKFVTDLYELWQREGALTLELARQEDPAGFCRMVATLLPKEAQVEVNVTHVDAKQRLGRKLHAVVDASPTPEPSSLTH